MSKINEEEIRKRVETRIKQRQEFWVHLVIYVAVHLFLWMIYFLTSPGGFPWPIFPMGGWGIGLFSHAVETYMKTSVSFEERRERAIQEEIERERQRLLGEQLAEKPKRDQRVRLAEDGELVYEEDEPRRARRSDSRDE